MLDTVVEVEEEEGISGGWHVFIRISLHCLLKIEECLAALPKVEKKSEASYIQRMDVGIDISRFVTNVTPYVNHLECNFPLYHFLILLDVLEIFAMVLKAQDKAIAWTVDSIKAECSSCTIPPFWYSVSTIEHTKTSPFTTLFGN